MGSYAKNDKQFNELHTPLYKAEKFVHSKFSINFKVIAKSVKKMRSSVVFLIFSFFLNVEIKAVSIADYPELGIIVTSLESSEKILLPKLNSLKDHPKFNKNFPTVLYCFGYTQNFNEITVQTIMKAYQTRGGINFLVVDWANYSSGDYLAIRDDVYMIGTFVGRKLYELQVESNNTIQIADWHLVGHSMGSHLAGYIARSITVNTRALPIKIIIKRLTALDPAGPGYYDPISFTSSYLSQSQKPLQKSDGEIIFNT